MQRLFTPGRFLTGTPSSEKVPVLPSKENNDWDWEDDGDSYDKYAAIIVDKQKDAGGKS